MTRRRSLAGRLSRALAACVALALIVMVAASTLDKEIEGNGGNKTAARAVGKLVAERCKAKGIDTVVFDRGGYLYHGRVAELAEGAREGGLEF